jgi:hypothetical protein
MSSRAGHDSLRAPTAVPPRTAATTNDTLIRSVKPPASGAIDYFDDLTLEFSLRVTSKDMDTWRAV